MDEHESLNTEFEHAWERAALTYRVHSTMKEACRHLYLSGRIDGMAYLTDKNLEVSRVRRAHKATVRGMEGQ